MAGSTPDPTNRTVLAVIGLTVIALAVAIVLVMVGARPIEQGSAPPSASATGTAASSSPIIGPTASASSAPTPTAQGSLAGSYGYVTLVGRDVFEIRRERDASLFDGTQGRYVAVSADGRRFAYWRLTPNVGAIDLRVAETRDPGMTDHSVYQVPGGQLGGALVWSNDGLGLLVTTYSIETAGPAGGPPGSGAPARYDLLMIDLSTTPARVALAAPTATHGFVYVPVGWDRPGRVATGVITGEGGFTRDYVVWNGNSASPMKTVPLGATLLAFGVQASPDAKLVIGWELVQPPTLRVWPIDDPSKSRTIPASGQFSQPFWRNSSEVIWTVGQRVQTVRVADGSVTTVFTGGDQQIFATAARADGSGVVIAQRLGPPGSDLKIFVLDVVTGKTVDMWTNPSDVGFLPRGVFLPF